MTFFSACDNFFFAFFLITWKKVKWSSFLTELFISYRKELESKLDADGDSCLLDPSVVDAHPIIFWNLIWYFERVAVRSHLVGHCLRAASLNPEPAVAHESWAGCDHGNVFLG